MEKLDPKVVALAKAIRQAESNGNFTARSKDGSFGAYQFLKETWDRTAKKYGVKAQWDKATPQQQNEVAYKQLKEWKDKGYNVGQIASMWNAGSGRPNAYLEGKSGTNKSGVKYNVSKYAEKVATLYQGFVGNPQFKVLPKEEAIVDPRQQMIDSGQAVGNQKRYERTGKAGPSFGGSIVRGIVKPIVSAGLSVAAPFSKDGITIGSKYLGQTSDFVTENTATVNNLSNKVNSGEKTMAGGLLGVAGAAAKPALDLLGVAPIGPVGAVGKTAIGSIKTGQSVAKTAGQVLKTSAIRGGGFAGAYDVANQLSSGEKYDPLQTAGAVAVGTALDLGLSRGVPAVVNKFTAKGKAGSVNKVIANREKELANIESNYSKLREAQEYSKDANAASRKRVASTDVLTNATDNTGTIRTTNPGGAVDQYKSVIKLDDYEATVRENLARLGEKVSLKDVETELTNAVNKSGLEGADLRNALNNIKKEIAGYRLKADKGGMIPLAVVHDAKISTTRGINYLTPPEVKAYRKAVANGLRKTVEDKSNVSVVIDGKTYKVKDINAELAKYYQDITYLENLDGRKVKDGKLGKYFAQTVGAIVGSHFGPFGAIVGSEVGGGLKGSMLSKTLGGKTGYKPPTNKILEKASEQGKLPQLQLPAPKAGAPKTQIGSGKPIPLPAKNPLDQGVVDANYSKSLGNRKINQSTTITPTKKLINKQSTKLGEKSSLLGSIKQGVKNYIDDPQVGLSTKNVASGASALGKKIVKEGEQKPTLKLKRDVQVTTLSGEKTTIPEDEILKAYESGGKALLKDGREYIVSKSQYENIKNNSLKSEAKEFAPELKGTEETVLGTEKRVGTLPDYARSIGKTVEEARATWKPAFDNKTKYSQYQLPEGKNYKEVLIKAPVRENSPYWLENKKTGEVKSFDNADLARKEMMKQEVKTDFQIRPQSANIDFKSSHWEEPNVISHLRLNERTYKGKKVTFMEELQSDWARERRKYDNTPLNIEDTSQNVKVPNNPLLKNWQELSIKRALKEAVDNNSEYLAWTTGEQQQARYNLSTQVEKINWFDPSTAQTGRKTVVLEPKGSGKRFEFEVNKDGNITTIESGTPTDWKGKNVAEVIGKGIGERIVATPKGTLQGEGLNIGGEWANNLYDKQVKNIVEDLTGAKVEMIDLGLPIDGKKGNEFVDLSPKDIKVGAKVWKGTWDNYSTYIITDVLGDGKFKAVPKKNYDLFIKNMGGETPTKADLERASFNYGEQFDISTKKSTGQQAIKITPEIKALVKGEAPKIYKTKLGER